MKVRNRFLFPLTAVISAAALLPAARAQDPVGFETPESYALGYIPELLSIADLNGDGILDIAAANTDSDSAQPELGNSVSALLGAGDGTFAPGGTYPAGDRPEGFTLRDVDNDGRLDAVTSNMEGDSIAVLLGAGDGSFAPPLSSAAPGGPRGIVLSDFDGDGLLDAATANYDTDSVSLFRGDGSGGFALASTLSAGESPEVIATGQLAGDPAVDLVTANSGSDDLTVLEGRGDGGFSVAGTHAVGARPRFVLPADLDGDGLDDLIVANHEAHDIGLERNVGGGRFENAGRLAHASLRRPVALAIADITRDGVPDLLTASITRDLLFVFPGAAAPFAFDAAGALYFETGAVPVDIGVADLDADGFEEVVVTNGRSHSLFVYRSYLPRRGLIADNSDPGASHDGVWELSEGPFPFGSDSLSATRSARFSWEVPLPAAGEHEVLLWWTVTPSRDEAVRVRVDHAGGATDITVDQRRGLGIWSSLGRYSFGAAGRVTITAPERSDRTACADAVRFVAVPGRPNAPPVAEITSVRPNPAREGDLVRFESTDADADGEVVQREWRSSIDGLLSTEPAFETASLRPGVHAISFEVTDDDGARSQAAVVELAVNTRPRPLADAGPDQDVDEAAVVFLEGGASSPGDGSGDASALAYLWEQVSGTGVELEGERTALASFIAPRVLADETLVFQLTVVEGGLLDADLVEVLVRDVGPGVGRVSALPRPEDIALEEPLDEDPAGDVNQAARDGRLVLAFHGRLAVANDLESEDWVGAAFDAAGTVDPGARVVSAWLFADSNGSGALDPGDLQLGESRHFAAGRSSTLVFSDFLRTLVDGETEDFFIACELAPEVVVDSGSEAGLLLPFGPPYRPEPLLFLLLAGLLAATTLLLASVPGGGRFAPRLRAGLATPVLLASLSLLPSCGGGGGGGGTENGPDAPADSGSDGGGGTSVAETLRLELIDLQLLGATSGEPASIEGLPLRGWEI
jgi:hypothetical protein